ARLDIELHAIYEEAVARFGNLGGAIVGLAVKTREDGRIAIPAAARAPAAQFRFDDGIVPPGIRMRSADKGAADGREMAGRQALGHHIGEAPPDEVVNANLGLEIKADGRR